MNFVMNIKPDSSSYDFNNHDIIDNDTLEQIKLESDNDDLIVREIYFSYFSEAEILLKRINDYFDKSDYEKLRTKIHSLTGISETVGAKKLNEISKFIESIIREKKYDELSLLIPILNTSHQELKNTIKQMI